MPIVPAAQVRSPSERIDKPRCRANSTTASTQPAKPPWNDIPPFHSSKISLGCSMKCGRFRKSRQNWYTSSGERRIVIGDAIGREFLGAILRKVGVKMGVGDLLQPALQSSRDQNMVEHLGFTLVNV